MGLPPTLRSALVAAVAAAVAVNGLDNGLGLTPPLGWRSYNAFGGRPTQLDMEATMDAMVSTARSVDGVPTSLLQLGYNHVGLDGGWNQCYAENHTFHWASDGRPVWNSAFPDPQHMVDKAHRLKLSPGWYLNNCGCAENAFDEEMADRVMRGSVKMLADQGWDGVKFDSCSQMRNLSKWAELINETGRPVLIENCFQGGFTPGMAQWQGYIKNKTAAGGFSHYLGMFFGMERSAILPSISFDDCKHACDANGTDCGGFTFESRVPVPAGKLSRCYVQKAPRKNRMDMSNSNYCTGDSNPSDCPYNLYRVSGDISASWDAMLGNLAYTLPFLGEGGVHLPFPQDPTVRSRPGGWAYPDMLEVANLVNATEDRSHFGAWSIMSSPLILSFNLSNPAKMDRVWPIITNKAVLGVNQRWAGDPGRRITLSPDGWQAWAKPMAKLTYAVFVMNTGRDELTVSLPLVNVSVAFPATSTVCVKDLYTGKALPPMKPGVPLVATLPVHDSAMYCAWPGTEKGGCSNAAAKDCP